MRKVYLAIALGFCCQGILAQLAVGAGIRFVQRDYLYQNDPSAVDRGLKKAMEVLK